MYEMDNERLYHELEKFVATRLRPIPFFNHYYIEYLSLRKKFFDVEQRFGLMNKIWGEYQKGKRWKNLVSIPQLTNHEICHEMFWNAFRGRSRMYIQLPNLTSEENAFTNFLDKNKETRWTKGKDKEDIITLSCTLLTLQMLDYDIMMFRAMYDQEDEEYRKAAIEHYRPYLFNYVAEIDRKRYNELQKLQNKQKQQSTTLEGAPADARDEPYLWLECTFNLNASNSPVGLNGYVVQSASSIEKIKAALRIIEDEGTSIRVKRETLDEYELINPCKQDDEFKNELQHRLGRLSSINIYRIGNGNCVYAKSMEKGKSFFFDIGFNHKHRPKKISPTSTYNYSSAMRKIFANDPSLFILSHWDLDHIAGSFAARKDFLDKKWFAPDCNDACIDAQRLAKYLDMKGNLFRVARDKPGRMIGQISIGKNTIYKFFMGEKAACDRSKPNCEGIVIKYEDVKMKKTLMMMGDVNYASYNKAIEKYNAGSPIKHEPLFADTMIDYLIVPHHGSGHTAYNLITGSHPIVKKTKAFICCTNEDERPNSEHKVELEKRFTVSTTQKDAKTTDYIEIKL